MDKKEKALKYINDNATTLGKFLNDSGEEYVYFKLLEASITV